MDANAKFILVVASIGGVIAAVFLGLMFTQVQKNADNFEKAIEENKAREAELNSIAKTHCQTSTFYAGNFERCERLEVRP
jgi:hypothetical protein